MPPILGKTQVHDKDSRHEPNSFNPVFDEVNHVMRLVAQ
jgi:hypothetical protein